MRYNKKFNKVIQEFRDKRRAFISMDYANKSILNSKGEAIAYWYNRDSEIIKAIEAKITKSMKFKVEAELVATAGLGPSTGFQVFSLCICYKSLVDFVNHQTPKH